VECRRNSYSHTLNRSGQKAHLQERTIAKFLTATPLGASKSDFPPMLCVEFSHYAKVACARSGKILPREIRHFFASSKPRLRQVTSSDCNRHQPQKLDVVWFMKLPGVPLVPFYRCGVGPRASKAGVRSQITRHWPFDRREDRAHLLSMQSSRRRSAPAPDWAAR
jgi:hypothetical protein